MAKPPRYDLVRKVCLQMKHNQRNWLNKSILKDTNISINGCIHPQTMKLGW